VSPALRSEAIGFWLGHRLLGESCLVERRSHELVYLARAPDGQLAGLATVGLGRRTHDGRNIYDLRVYVAPPHRGSPLALALVQSSRELLRADSLVHPAAGLRVIAEIPKLARPGIRRYLERHGFVHRGRTSQGFDCWVAPFD
jgi:GNAT superfamily N-acetyltransferase